MASGAAESPSPPPSPHASTVPLLLFTDKNEDEKGGQKAESTRVSRRNSRDVDRAYKVVEVAPPSPRQCFLPKVVLQHRLSQPSEAQGSSIQMEASSQMVACHAEAMDPSPDATPKSNSANRPSVRQKLRSLSLGRKKKQPAVKEEESSIVLKSKASPKCWAKFTCRFKNRLCSTEDRVNAVNQLSLDPSATGSEVCVCTAYKRTNSDLDTTSCTLNFNLSDSDHERPGKTAASTELPSAIADLSEAVHLQCAVTPYPVVSPAGQSRGEMDSQGEEFFPLDYPVHTQIDYVHCLVPDLASIASCSFYWGVMDRYKAEKLLENKPDGTFLLRDSAQEDFLFSVSFRRYGRSLHARIEQWNYRFSFDSRDTGVFASPTVCGLIEHYKDPSCCMFFEPMLTIPLNRNFVFSLQHLSRTVICSNTSYDGISSLPLPKSLKIYAKEYHYKQKVRVRRFEHEKMPG